MKVLLNYTPSAAHFDALRAAAPHAEIAIAHDEESAGRLVVDADAILGNRYFLQSIDRATRLRWFQSNSVGMDLVLRAGHSLDGVIVTNARGVYSAEMAEHAIALVFALFRRLHELRDEQLRGEWTPRPLSTVSGATFLILGWGSVGSEIGKRLTALGATVHGVGNGRMTTPVAVISDWRDLLPRTDCLILALPLTSRTRHLVGVRELALLPRSSFVVNVGRGMTIDETALLDALRESRLAGAALDVLDEEPPPADSSIWRMPSLLVTPHVARSREDAPPYKWEPLFEENLRRFAAGEPLLNVVDREREY